MAEIGIVASIIGVAGAGFRLSLILNAISCEVANAPIEIHHISKSVTLFSLMLKQAGTVLQAADTVQSHEAVEATKQVADESNRVFDEINEMLDRVRNRDVEGSLKPTARQKIKWCFKKTRITYLLGQLESLKLSLSLMLQILQLGKIMASTSRSDPPEVVSDKSAAIQQERAEAQNTLIVRYMQYEETEKLYKAYNTDDGGGQSPIEYKTESESHSQLSAIPPPEYRSPMHLDRLPLYTLGDIDEMLRQMSTSSREMVRISDQAIDRLLEKWTRWHEVREQRHTRQSNGRYAATVHHLYEDDLPYHERFEERDGSPRGYYLEGTTTDWRRPNSAMARQEYSRRKRQYMGYQPSVSAQSSDQEASPASNASSKRNTKRHVINSSSESSDSEPEPQRSAPKSAIPTFQPGPPLNRSISSHAISSNNQVPPQMPPSPAQSMKSRPPISPQYVSHPSGRPYPGPDQTPPQHATSMPLPPIYTHNATNPYAQNGPPSPNYSHHSYGAQLGAPSMWAYSSLPGRGGPTRPMSKDGPGRRSPSRLSQEVPREREYDRQRERDRERERERDSYRTRDRDRDRDYDRDYPRSDKKSKESRSKALREGATKGLLGAGAIAGFLEALEGLSI